MTGAGAHELAYSIKELACEVRGLRKDMQYQQQIMFGANGDNGMVVAFKILESKVRTALWLGGVAASAVITSAIGVAFYMIINYGPKGLP